MNKCNERTDCNNLFNKHTHSIAVFTSIVPILEYFHFAIAHLFIVKSGSQIKPRRHVVFCQICNTSRTFGPPKMLKYNSLVQYVYEILFAI